MLGRIYRETLLTWWTYAMQSGALPVPGSETLLIELTCEMCSALYLTLLAADYSINRTSAPPLVSYLPRHRFEPGPVCP